MSSFLPKYEHALVRRWLLFAGQADKTNATDLAILKYTEHGKCPDLRFRKSGHLPLEQVRMFFGLEGSVQRHHGALRRLDVQFRPMDRFDWQDKRASLSTFSAEISLPLYWINASEAVISSVKKRQLFSRARYLHNRGCSFVLAHR